MREHAIGLLLIAVVALGAMTGVAAAEGDLGVTVDDADGEPTVAVTENDTAVENATVTVSVVDPANESYAGTGTHGTDANGTVDLEAPAEDVTVNVTAEYENASVTETVNLEAPDGLEVDVEDTDAEPVVTVADGDTAVENASVNVTTADDENATYDGEGAYETDANGTVTLPAAEENLTVNVTAEYENASVTETVDLTVADEEAAESRPFGQLVRDLVDRVRNGEGGVGAAVSDFVTENNPGNAPDRAGSPGGPDDAANGSDAANASEAPGNAPDHAGPSDENDSERGPPEHAGPGGDDGANESGDDAEEADDRGPPEHAGPGGDDGDAEEDDSDDAEEGDGDGADDDAAEENDADDADDAEENDSDDDADGENDSNDDADGENDSDDGDDGSPGNGSDNGNAPGN